MLLNLLGTPSPIVELFLLGVVLYIISAIYFSTRFEAEDIDRSAGQMEPTRTQTAEGTQGEEP